MALMMEASSADFIEVFALFCRSLFLSYRFFVASPLPNATS